MSGDKKTEEEILAEEDFLRDLEEENKEMKEGHNNFISDLLTMPTPKSKFVEINACDISTGIGEPYKIFIHRGLVVSVRAITVQDVERIRMDREVRFANEARDKAILGHLQEGSMSDSPLMEMAGEMMATVSAEEEDKIRKMAKLKADDSMPRGVSAMTLIIAQNTTGVGKMEYIYSLDPISKVMKDIE